MPDAEAMSIAEARIKEMAEKTLERTRDKIKALQPKYDEAREAAGGPELSPKVQALVDQVLAYHSNMGPHGAIWHLAKAHTIALELVSPQATIEEFEKLKEREQDILKSIKAAEKGDQDAVDELAKFFDETGRPLQ